MYRKRSTAMCEAHSLGERLGGEHNASMGAGTWNLGKTFVVGAVSAVSSNPAGWVAAGVYLPKSLTSQEVQESTKKVEVPVIEAAKAAKAAAWRNVVQAEVEAQRAQAQAATWGGGRGDASKPAAWEIGACIR